MLFRLVMVNFVILSVIVLFNLGIILFGNEEMKNKGRYFFKELYGVIRFYIGIFIIALVGTIVLGIVIFIVKWIIYGYI
ncbi:MAG: hypothetical protein ACLR60_11855 [Clostridium paraputrificum]